MSTNSTTAEGRLADLSMERGLTVIQRVAVCFAAGVIGGLAVVLFSHVLFELGPSLHYHHRSCQCAPLAASILRLFRLSCRQRRVAGTSHSPSPAALVPRFQTPIEHRLVRRNPLWQSRLGRKTAARIWAAGVQETPEESSLSPSPVAVL